jgi:hypothetical protein
MEMKPDARAEMKSAKDKQIVVLQAYEPLRKKASAAVKEVEYRKNSTPGDLAPLIKQALIEAPKQARPLSSYAPQKIEVK